MSGAPSDFVKQLESDADALKSKLKKTNTAEKTWTPTADGTRDRVLFLLLPSLWWLDVVGLSWSSCEMLLTPFFR